MKTFHSISLGSTLLLIAVLVVNYATTGMMGDLATIFPLLHMPPGYVFGVAWGLIYCGLVIAIGSWWSVRVGRNKTRKEIHHLFWISCILNALWIFFTIQQQYVVSVAILFSLRYLLLVMVTHMLKKRHKIHLQYQTLLPFSGYLGWISVASFMLGISQIVYLGLGATYANSIVWIVLSMLTAVCVVCRTVHKTTPRTGVLPVFAFVAIAIKLRTGGQQTMGIIALLAGLVIACFMRLRRLDFSIK